ncbi:MAG: AAA family ATPase [Bacteroidaceae bacterium]|nr:AAA family ATPase [Bacteroidaceae bacterium]
MKLKSLYIKKYKNLSGTYNFEKSNAYVALIGLNGSGKSNLLEVISIIFKIITESCPPNSIGDFSFTYEIEGSMFYAEYRDAIGKLFVNNTQRRPSSIISCYSGEDDRLWEQGFKDLYVKFFNTAIEGGDYKPTSLYINKYCWKIAFISLLFSENDEVKRFINDKLHVNHDTITIQFKSNDNITPQPHDASNWYKRVETKYLGAEISIDDLKNNEDVELLCGKYPYLTNDQIVFYYLYFLCMPNKNRIEGLKADKIIESIDIKLNGYNFDALSEGEKKLILIECITKVLGDENSLILLDEPDAHTHIAMKKDLLKLISEFEGQTIMTTHSPMFLNKRWDGFDENNIFYMHDGKIESTEPLKHLAELTDNEIDYFEGSFILSSKKILVTEGTYDGLYLIQAVSFFENDDAKYSKLRNIAIVYSGGTGNALSFYEQILKDTSDYHDKIVYLFDYDKAGLMGWKSINGINDPKVTPIFYQEDYSIALNTNVSDNNIAPKDTIMVEDLFDSHSYESKVKVVHDMNTHRDFRCNTQGRTTEAIKSYIEKNYKTFKPEWFLGFKPTLDKLLEVFDLN